MINNLKLFFNNKSRFYFNLSFIELIKKTFLFCFNIKKNHQEKVKQQLNKFFPSSNFFFFNHGRSGLFFLLENYKIRKQKKVLINSLTLFEMINMIIYAGYEPVFIDNIKNSFKSNTLNLIEKYKDDIGFVVVTHLNGINHEIFQIKNKIDQINKDRTIEEKIFLIEDVAVSFGAKYKNQNCGSIGDFSIISFNIMKNITSLTGGVLIDNYNLINNSSIEKNLLKNTFFDLAKKLLFVFMLQFLNSKIIFPFFFIFIKLSHKKKLKFFLRKYRTDFITYRAENIPNDFLKKLSNFQYYLLIDQFDQILKKIQIRNSNSKYLYENLKKNKNLIFPQSNFDEENIFIEFPIICINKKYKDEIFNKSLDLKVDIKNYYYTNCQTDKLFINYNNNHCYNSEQISKNILMLPVNISQTKKDLDKIIKLFE